MTDRCGWTVAWIYVAGVNVNYEIVKAGLGWWFRKHAPDDNLLEELEENRDRTRSDCGQTRIRYRRERGVT